MTTSTAKTGPNPTIDVVCVLGLSGSGKTTLAKALEEQGASHIRFSYPMKRFVAERYGVTVEFLDSQEGKATRIYPDGHPQEKMTYGSLMVGWYEATVMVDPYCWLAETQAEMDHDEIDQSYSARPMMVFSDLRKMAEVDMVLALLAKGHRLTRVVLDREGSVVKESDEKLPEILQKLVEAHDLDIGGPLAYMEAENADLEDLLDSLDELLAAPADGVWRTNYYVHPSD